MKIVEHNVETGEAIEREMTPDELTQAKIDAKDEASRFKAKADQAAAKQAILDRLGITADEAALLLK